MTRLRSVDGGATRDTDYPDSDFVAEVLSEHPELIPTPASHTPGWVSRRNGLVLLAAILIAVAAVIVSSLWSGHSKANLPKQQNQPNPAVRLPSRPSALPPSVAGTGVGAVQNSAPAVPPSTGPVPPKAVVVPAPRVSPDLRTASGQPSQQTSAATVSPSVAPSPTVSPSPVASVPPSPTCARVLPNGRCKPLPAG